MKSRQISTSLLFIKFDNRYRPQEDLENMGDGFSCSAVEMDGSGLGWEAKLL